MKIPERFEAFLKQGVGSLMGTRDKDLMPEVNRVLGMQIIGDDRLRYFVDGPTSRRIFSNLEQNRHVTVVTCSNTFESYQFKGKHLGHRDATEEENEFVMEYFRVFNEAMRMFGLTDGLALNYPHSHMIAMDMEVEEMFEQTPKVGTGQKI